MDKLFAAVVAVIVLVTALDVSLIWLTLAK
jgi:hypothetical protein